MKHIIVILLIILIAYFCFQSYYEGFTPYGPYQIGNNAYQNAGGSAPAGVNALPGAQQMVQNATVASVDPVPSGNPQNVLAEYKQQPL
jgi:hypothetical protein